MLKSKLSRLEMRIMDALWNKGQLSIREITDAFPEKDRPAYTTIQTMVYRMESKKILRRTRKIGNAHIFEPLITRQAAQNGLINDFLSLFGGRVQPVMANFIETGRLTLNDLREAEKTLRRLKDRHESEPQ